MKAGMDCIVVGGCANGIVLQKIRMDAQFIELKRPEYIKPLEAVDAMPEAASESDVYEIHAIQLVNTQDRSQAVFGIACVEGMKLTDAFSEIVKSHVEGVTQKLMAAGVVTKQ
jgi:hypothetical protein